MRDTIETDSPKTGGEGGIRTHEHLAMLLDFQSSAFDHSATSPIQSARMISSLRSLGRRASKFGWAINAGSLRRTWHFESTNQWN